MVIFTKPVSIFLKKLLDHLIFVHVYMFVHAHFQKMLLNIKDVLSLINYSYLNS